LEDGEGGGGGADHWISGEAEGRHGELEEGLVSLELDDREAGVGGDASSVDVGGERERGEERSEEEVVELAVVS
jgi:hypothetical protein